MNRIEHQIEVNADGAEKPTHTKNQSAQPTLPPMFSMCSPYRPTRMRVKVGPGHDDTEKDKSGLSNEIQYYTANRFTRARSRVRKPRARGQRLQRGERQDSAEHRARGAKPRRPKDRRRSWPNLRNSRQARRVRLDRHKPAELHRDPPIPLPLRRS